MNASSSRSLQSVFILLLAQRYQKFDVSSLRLVVLVGTLVLACFAPVDGGVLGSVCNSETVYAQSMV